MRLARALLAGLLSLEGGAQAAPVLVLDAGHGGHDWGAINRDGQIEKDLALMMARKVKERLEKGGTLVRLTRDSDDFLRLDERIKKSQDLEADVFVSLHLNQTRNRRAQGIQVYSFGARHGRRPRPRRRSRRRGGLPELAAPPRERAQESALLAASLVEAFRADGLRVDPISRAQYYVLKNPEAPSILVELGFLSNPEEARRLADPEYQDRLASILARTLSEYLTRVEPPEPASELALKSP